MRTGDRAPAPRSAAEVLREQMEERGVTIRGLARLIADAPSADPKAEGWRVKLTHYLGGRNPTEDQAAVIEARLGLAAGLIRRHDPRAPRAAAGDDLVELGDLVARLATAVRLLAEAQRPPLRRQLLAALEEG